MAVPDPTAAHPGRDGRGRWRGTRAARNAFRTDPLSFLETALHDERSRQGQVDALWFAPGRLLVVDPAAARDVLGNRDGAYREHSDFFFTRHGAPGPRSAQIRIGRDARNLLQRHHCAHARELPGLVAATLAPVSHWPDAGNRLLHTYLRDVLLRPDGPPDVRRTVGRILERAVLAGARDRRNALSRLLLRTEAVLRLGAELDRRRRRGTTEQLDLFDVVVDGGLDAPVEQLVEVYLSFLFALSGSLGFALGWAVYLLGTGTTGTTGPTDGTGLVDGTDGASQVVHEALRMWPVAWLFGRWPAHQHRIAGVDVGPSDEVNVCTWLIHRDPRHWHQPERFLPRRWADAGRSLAYLPFGFGPHACTGAGISLRLLEELVRLLRRDWRMTVTPHHTCPHVGAALAPPPFTVELRQASGGCDESSEERR